MAQVKKLSVAKVFGKVDLEALIKADGQRMHCGRYMGIASGVKTGVSDYGVWKALTGSFEGVSPDGEVSAAPYLFLPEVAQIPIELALAAGSQAVSFAVDVFVKYAKDSQTKYEYTFESVIPPSQDDPMQKLKAQVAALALPAPTKAAEPAPAAKTAKK